MKTPFLRLIFLVCIATVQCNGQSNELVLRLNPRESTEGTELTKVSFVLSNGTADTLLILGSPIVVAGDSGSGKILFWPDPSSMVNLLYYEPCGHNLPFVGDGTYRKSVPGIPELVTLPPQGKLRLQVSLPHALSRVLARKRYCLWGAVTYGQKSDLDRLCRNRPELKRQYLEALKNKDVLTVSSIRAELLVGAKENRADESVMDFLRHGFKYRVASKRDK